MRFGTVFDPTALPITVLSHLSVPRTEAVCFLVEQSRKQGDMLMSALAGMAERLA